MNLKTKALIRLHFTRFLSETGGKPSADSLVEKIIEVSDRYNLDEHEVSDYLMKEGAFTTMAAKVMNLSGEPLAKAGNAPKNVIQNLSKVAKQASAQLSEDAQREFNAATNKMVAIAKNAAKQIGAQLDSIKTLPDNIKAEIQTKLDTGLPAIIGDQVQTIGAAIAQTLQAQQQQAQQAAQAQAAQAAQPMKQAKEQVPAPGGATVPTAGPVATAVTHGSGKLLRESEAPVLDEISVKISGIPE